MSTNWSDPTNWETVCKRNAGRRHHNSWRRFMRAYRRQQVAERLLRHGSVFDHGLRTEIARRLGVHRSTISRDIKAILEAASLFRPCPICRHEVLVLPDRLGSDFEGLEEV